MLIALGLIMPVIEGTESARFAKVARRDGGLSKPPLTSNNVTFTPCLVKFGQLEVLCARPSKKKPPARLVAFIGCPLRNKSTELQHREREA